MTAKIKNLTLILIDVFGCLLISVNSCRVSAQTLDVLKVAGIVQFVEGHAVKNEAGVQSDLVYQSSLYENERVETPRGAALKIAARNGCTFVMRGEGAAAASSEKKPWRFKGESLRAICSAGSASGAGEVIAFSNTAITIRDGEVLLLTEKPVTSPTTSAAPVSATPSFRALVLKGSVQIRGQNLEPRKLYTIDSSAIAEVTPQLSESDLRELNLRSNPPRESKEWPKPAAPPKLPTVRIIFGPAMSVGRVLYDNDKLNQKNLAGDGPRLQLHFRRSNDTSLIFSASHVELQDKDQNGDNSNQPDGVTNRINTDLLEVGYRFHHDRWWSPFYKIGAGYSTSEISIRKSPSYSQYKYEFYDLSAALGIDAQVIPSLLGGFGLYGSVEAQVIQSLWRGERENRSGSNAGVTPVEEPWRLTQVAAIVGFGIEYEF